MAFKAKPMSRQDWRALGRPSHKNYIESLRRENESIRNAMAHAENVSPAERRRRLEAFDSGLERGHIERVLELLLRWVQKNEETLIILQSNPDAWGVRDGVLGFSDRSLLERYSAGVAEAQTIQAEIRAPLRPPRQGDGANPSPKS